MSNKVIIGLLFFIGSISTFAFASEPQSIVQIGNTSGNLNNKGKYVSQDDWIFYSSLSQKGGLYKVKKDGTEKTKIMDGYQSYMNILGDYLYYSGDGWELTKIKLDGSEKEIFSKSAFHINVIKDYIYYTYGAGYQDGFIYRMKTDGSEKSKLSSDHASQIIVKDNWIYYTSYYQKLIKMDINGNSKTKLLSGKSISELNVEGDWLFFNYDRKLYKMKNDGTELICLSSDDARYINVYGEWVYYSNFSNKKNLVRIKMDGTQRKEINQIKSFEISIIDNCLFFYDMSKMVKLEIKEIDKDMELTCLVGVFLRDKEL